MELRRYTALLRRWWLLIVLFILLGAGLALLRSVTTVPVYSASTTLQVDTALATANSSVNDLVYGERLAQTYAQTMRARAVMDRVIQKLGLKDSPGSLAARVTLAPLRNTNLLSLAVEDGSPQRAAAIANQIVTEFIGLSEEVATSQFSAQMQGLQVELTKIQNDIATTQASLDALLGKTDSVSLTEQNRLQGLLAQSRNSETTLLARLDDYRLAQAQNTDTIRVVDQAQPQLTPVQPRTRDNILFGSLLGLILAVALIFVRDQLDDTVKTAEDVEQLTGVAGLGSITSIAGDAPKDKLVTVNDSRSPVAEAYRVLAANIQFSEIDAPIRAMVVTSGTPSEGKTTTLANLAMAFAQLDKRVIAVDCDLRKPTLHKYFGHSNTIGVTTALLDHEGSVADHLMPSGFANLQLLLSGPLPPNPAELVGSHRMERLVNELKQVADIVLFDTPPSLIVADASLLGRICDATLLVVRSAATRRGAVKASLVQIRQSGSRLLGFVINRVPQQAGGYYYYYYGEGDAQRRHTWYGDLLHRLPIGANGKQRSAKHKPAPLAVPMSVPVEVATVISPNGNGTHPEAAPKLAKRNDQR